MDPICYKCNEKNPAELQDMFGYTICSSCRSKMGLYQDKTLKKYVKSFEEAKKLDPGHLSFEEEMLRRLEIVEKDYISKKIKLQYILDRIRQNQ